MEGSFERKAVGNLGSEIIQNGTKTDHLEYLGCLGLEIIQNDTKIDHLEHLATKRYRNRSFERL